MRRKDKQMRKKVNNIEIINNIKYLLGVIGNEDIKKVYQDRFKMLIQQNSIGEDVRIELEILLNNLRKWEKRK